MLWVTRLAGVAGDWIGLEWLLKICRFQISCGMRAYKQLFVLSTAVAETY